MSQPKSLSELKAEIDARANAVRRYARLVNSDGFSDTFSKATATEKVQIAELVTELARPKENEHSAHSTLEELVNRINRRDRTFDDLTLRKAQAICRQYGLSYGHKSKEELIAMLKLKLR